MADLKKNQSNADKVLEKCFVLGLNIQLQSVWKYLFGVQTAREQNVPFLAGM